VAGESFRSQGQATAGPRNTASHSMSYAASSIYVEARAGHSLVRHSYDGRPQRP